jgi:hypothetical protein
MLAAYRVCKGQERTFKRSLLHKIAGYSSICEQCLEVLERVAIKVSKQVRLRSEQVQDLIG